MTRSPSDSGVVLSASGVEKRYPGDAPPALDDVSLELGVGTCLALVGESGSGKTTLLRCFNRTVTPDRGVVEVRGRPVTDLDAIDLRRSMGFVQQEGGLLPHWSVLRNAALVPTLLRMPDPEEKARQALVGVGLDPDVFASRWPRSLSGGQRQRVALARALAANPDVLLLDEPFSALDAVSRADLHRTFAALREAGGLTALLVTHDLREASVLADEIAVIRGGRVLQRGTLPELAADPGHPYVTLLLEEAGVA